MADFGIFSYGSLIIPESASKAVGRPVSASGLVDAVLTGYRRYWGAFVPITMAEMGDKEVDGVFYDLRAAASHYTSGVLLPVSEEELESACVRELQYDAIDVTRQIFGAPRPKKVVTFIAKPEHRTGREDYPDVLPLRYQSRVLTAAKGRGESFEREFLVSGDDAPPHLQPVDGAYRFVDPEQAKRV